MLTDIDILSIVLLESFGVISFLLALVFFQQSRKIGDKQESLKKAVKDDVWNGSCYSYKWIMSHTLKPRKVFAATPFLAVLAFFMGWFLLLLLGPGLLRLGYFPLVALIGIAILLETDAFEAYSYSKAVHNVALDGLSKEDLNYMELAKEALDSAVLRFLIIGILFAVAGPFIPKIFDGLVYALVTYTRLIFHATEASKEISQGLALAIAFSLTVVLLYLPELVGRIIFRRVKLLARRMWEHLRKR